MKNLRSDDEFVSLPGDGGGCGADDVTVGVIIATIAAAMHIHVHLGTA